MPKGLSLSGGVAEVASLLAALCAGAGAALAQAPARPADAERELVWYTAMNTPDEDPEPNVKQFFAFLPLAVIFFVCFLGGDLVVDRWRIRRAVAQSTS